MNVSLKRIISLGIFVVSSLRGATVTYEFSGGRFGDNLLAFLRSEWISFRYDIPRFYKPFKYSDQLVLHLAGSKENEHFSQRSQAHKIVLTRQNMKIERNLNALYVIPYFSEAEGERNLPWNKNWIFFQVDWDNANFYKRISALVRPINSKLLDVNLPEDCVTVALHVRKGEGFDGPLLSEDTIKKDNVGYADINVPLKFPPNYFYTDQLKKISELYNGAKIYAFIFTDAANPAVIAQRFKDTLSDFPNIQLDYRKSANSHDSNVVEDFFAMTKFDCLIRPESNFSIVAAKIANYKLEIYPTASHWEGAKSVIDQVTIKMDRQFH